MPRATLAQLKESLRITDNNDDALLTIALNASIELVDKHCNRTFTASEVPSTRSFIPSGGRVEVDDFFTTEGLVITYGGTVLVPEVEGVSAGYRLLPDNAPEYDEPYTAIDFLGDGWAESWPVIFSRIRRVHVTAYWGYSNVPPASVIQAEILQATRFFSRKNSPFGVAGSPEVGSELRLLARVDPDVAVMLQPFVKLEVL